MKKGHVSLPEDFDVALRQSTSTPQLRFVMTATT
jgi:hypothetical protein